MLKHSRLVIAVTGSISSGKSAVGRMLAEAGVLVIDTDDLSRELMNSSGPTYDAVIARFGEDIVDRPGGPINRKRLGQKVFNDPQALKDLEAITHPAILSLVQQRVSQAPANQDVCVLVPLLFETGWHLIALNGRPFFDETWCISIDRARQIRLLCERNKISAQEAERLIDKQWTSQQKARLSTRVIDNNGSLLETRAQAIYCLQAARALAAQFVPPGKLSMPLRLLRHRVEHCLALLADRLHPSPAANEPALDRYEEDIRAYERNDAAAAPAGGGTVFTGSSTIALWSDLKQQMSELGAINRGFGGSTIPEVTHYAERIVTRYKPGKIVLYCGSNDGAEALHSGWRIYLDFRRFVLTVRRRLPDAQIYYVSISTAPSRLQFDREFKLANKLIADWCAVASGLRYVDVVPLMRNARGQLRTDWFGEDDLHMNPQGYAAWTPVLKRALRDS